MRPSKVKESLEEYEAMVKKIQTMQSAVKRSLATTTVMVLTVRQADGQDGGMNHFPITFNKELGQALYQASLEELQANLDTLILRMKQWK